MPKVEVYYNKRIAGYLEKKAPNHYEFRYLDEYLKDITAPGISLTLPKSAETYESDILFPFFFRTSF
jgi:HipA-like protein